MADFIGLDSDCVGDGEDAAQAADVWLHQRLIENAEALSEGLDGASCCFWQDGGPIDGEPGNNHGDRPWASLDWSYPVRIPFYLIPGLKKVEIACCWITHVFGATAAAVDIEWALLDATGQLVARERTTISNVIFDDSGNISAYHDLDLDSAYTGIEQTGTLRLGIKSRIGASYGTRDLAPNLDRRAINADRDLSSLSNPPQAQSPELTALTYNDAALDLLGVEQQSSPSPYLVYVDPVWRPATGGAEITFTASHMSYIQCRGIHVRPVYDPRSLLGVSAASMRARRPVRSTDMAPLHVQPAAYHERPRLLAWGPPGFMPGDRPEKWPFKYHTRFPRARGDLAWNLIDDSIVIPFDSGDIEIVLDLICVFGERTVTALRSGSAQWDLKAVLEQQNVAVDSWATPVEVASNTRSALELDAYVTMPLDPERFLIQEYIYRFPSGTVDVDNIGFPYREGQLYEEDQKLITRITVPLSVSGIVKSDTYRLRLNASYVANSLQDLPMSFVAGLSTNERLSLVCTGYSVYGVGAL